MSFLSPHHFFVLCHLFCPQRVFRCNSFCGNHYVKKYRLILHLLEDVGTKQKLGDVFCGRAFVSAFCSVSGTIELYFLGKGNVR